MKRDTMPTAAAALALAAALFLWETPTVRAVLQPASHPADVACGYFAFGASSTAWAISASARSLMWNSIHA